MIPLQIRSETLGDLECTVIDGGDAPEIAVVLCHGYGAPGDDLVGLAGTLVDLLDDAAGRFRFVFPEAPLSPPELADYGGRAWWAINMAALLAASQTRNFSELHESSPPGIEEATALLAGCVRQVLTDLGEQSRYVLGGFSQGAMLSANAVLSGEVPPPELLALFSGTLLRRPHWRDALLSGRLSRTRVLQSHGRLDPILPYSSAETLHSLIKASRPDAEFIAFDGPHTIPPAAIETLAVRLREIS